MMLAYGLILFYGAIKGETNPLAPISAEAPSTLSAKTTSALAFKTIHSAEELDAILAESKGKKVMLDFYADWCSSCKELDEITFKDPAVIQSLNDYVLVRADVTADSEAEKALTKQFGLFGPPAMIFFDENSAVIKGGDLIGFKNAEDFLSHIKTLETK
jgi:thiol:disulfide interchange protein DsbD